MYVRHLAWLHSRPDSATKKSRLASLKEANENNPLLELPDIETEHAASFVIGLLQEAGLMSTSGMGPVPLSWGDIESWLNCTEYDLPLWIKLKIKQLSEEYVYELVQANEDRNRPAPYEAVKVVDDDEEIAIQRNVVQDKIMGFLSRFRRNSAPEETKDEQ